MLNERYGLIDYQTMFWALAESPEPREGMLAFMEKRAPSWFPRSSRREVGAAGPVRRWAAAPARRQDQAVHRRQKGATRSAGSAGPAARQSESMPRVACAASGIELGALLPRAANGSCSSEESGARWRSGARRRSPAQRAGVPQHRQRRRRDVLVGLGVLPFGAAADGKLTVTDLAAFDPFRLLVAEPARPC